MDAQSFAPGYGKVLTVAAGLAGVGMVVVPLLDGQGRAALQWLPVAGALALGSWLVLWRPRVVVSDDGVTIVNIARTVRIPWSAVERVQARWALEITSGGHTWSAWAAPRGSAVAAGMRARRGESDAHAARGADAEVVSAAIRARRAEGRGADGSTGSAATVRWHARSLAALAGLVVVAAVALNL